MIYFSRAFSYFFEARAYAFVLAGVMIAWVAWQRLMDNSAQRLLNVFGVFSHLPRIRVGQ